MIVPVVAYFCIGVLLGIMLSVMVFVIWRTMRYIRSRSYRALEGKLGPGGSGGREPR